MNRLGALLAASLFLLSGCVGTETGNPPATDSSVEVGVFPPGAEVVVPPEVDATVVERASELGTVYLSLGLVELVPEGGCDPLLVAPDAASTDAVAIERPATGTFTAPAGSYCALRLWPTPAPEDLEVPPLLRGHTLAVQFQTETGADYVTLVSDRRAPVVLFADAGAFTLAEGSATVTLLVDAAGALVAREFWLQPAEPDGSWFFDEAGDASFLRLFESTPSLFRLFLGPPPLGVPSAADAGAGGVGGGAGGGAAAGDSLGTQLASSP